MTRYDSNASECACWDTEDCDVRITEWNLEWHKVKWHSNWRSLIPSLLARYDTVSELGGGRHLYGFGVNHKGVALRKYRAILGAEWKIWGFDHGTSGLPYAEGPWRKGQYARSARPRAIARRKVTAALEERLSKQAMRERLVEESGDAPRRVPKNPFATTTAVNGSDVDTWGPNTTVAAGRYAEILSTTLAAERGMKPAAVVDIDCDEFGPAYDALDWLFQEGIAVVGTLIGTPRTCCLIVSTFCLRVSNFVG